MGYCTDDCFYGCCGYSGYCTINAGDVCDWSRQYVWGTEPQGGPIAGGVVGGIIGIVIIIGIIVWWRRKQAAEALQMQMAQNNRQQSG
jgi:hypothetical protein